MAITLEFWKRKFDGAIYVNYNTNTYGFNDFLQQPDAKKIVRKMYKTIERDYPYEVKDDIGETVGNFINKHFLEADKTFDVVILGSGSKTKVIFNLEE